MVKLIILFRSGTHTPTYHESYNEFLMKLEALPGLLKKAVSTVYGATSGMLPYSTVVEATFASHEALEAALTSREGVEAGKLLVRFAGQDAVTMFADTLEESFAEST